MRGKYRFLHILPALTCIASRIINIPHLNGAFVTTDETTLPHHNHPKSVVYILVTLSSQYLSWFHFVSRILLFLQYLIDIQCGRELHKGMMTSKYGSLGRLFGVQMSQRIGFLSFFLVYEHLGKFSLKCIISKNNNMIHKDHYGASGLSSSWIHILNEFCFLPFLFFVRY